MKTNDLLAQRSLISLALSRVPRRTDHRAAGGLVAVAMPIIHLNGRYPSDFAASDGAFRFVWTLYASGTTGSLTVILALRELFSRRSSPSRPTP
jgi:hypothetical protein